MAYLTNYGSIAQMRLRAHREETAFKSTKKMSYLEVLSHSLKGILKYGSIQMDAFIQVVVSGGKQSMQSDLGAWPNNQLGTTMFKKLAAERRE